MGRLEKFRETQGKKYTNFDVEYHKELDREMKFAERKTCNETYDIRDKVTSGNPFTSSAQKILASELKHSEKPSIGQDANLHCDTTEPGLNDVIAMKKGGFTESAMKVNDKIVKSASKMAQGVEKRKAFQN